MEFFAAAKVSSSFPPPNLPEIAFAGRVLILRIHHHIVAVVVVVALEKQVRCFFSSFLIVFWLTGKSNVGKSSLLNALTRQWGVVRTSDKPGHTQVF